MQTRNVTRVKKLCYILETLPSDQYSKPANSKYNVCTINFEQLNSVIDQSSNSSEETSDCNISTNSKSTPVVPDDYDIIGGSSESGESGGNAYKFHTDQKTWNDARRTCIREGGKKFLRNQYHKIIVGNNRHTGTTV